MEVKDFSAVAYYLKDVYGCMARPEHANLGLELWTPELRMYKEQTGEGAYRDSTRSLGGMVHLHFQAAELLPQCH